MRVERWGPRTLDVDILLYDDTRVDDPDLTIPHPRMWERGFVLAPLRDVAPDLVDADATWEGVREAGVTLSLPPSRRRAGMEAGDTVAGRRTLALVGPGRAGTTHRARPARARLDGRRGRRPRARRAVDHGGGRVPRRRDPRSSPTRDAAPRS